jgi:hypothetical protein
MSDYVVFADALRQLLVRKDLRGEFMSLNSTDKACEDLKVPKSMAGELKNVLLEIERLSEQDASVSPNAIALDDDAAVRMRTQTLDSVSAAQTFLDNSFAQLRTAYRVSLAMSILLFVAGMAFLAIAAIRTFTHPESVTNTAVVASIGIVQIVALFYKNPLRDVGRSVSHAQQSKLAIMSYMLGVTLVGENVYHGKSTDEAGLRLSDLTLATIQLLERFSENSSKRRGETNKQSNEIPAAGSVSV